MEIEKNKKPNEIKILAKGLSKDTELVDYRLNRRFGGLTFGTVEQLSKNLGIKMTPTDGGIIFSAPKNRMQVFVEKLHFALVKFSQLS